MEIPDREHLAVAGVVEEVTGPPGSGVGRGFDLHELEAHRLGVEAVRRVEILGGDCYVVERHAPSLARCRIMNPVAIAAFAVGRGSSRSATGIARRPERSGAARLEYVCKPATLVALVVAAVALASRGRAPVPASDWFVAALVLLAGR